jgi:hypothetical protein
LHTMKTIISWYKHLYNCIHTPYYRNFSQIKFSVFPKINWHGYNLFCKISKLKCCKISPFQNCKIKLSQTFSVIWKVSECLFEPEIPCG